MEKLKLSHISPYLPYGLKCQIIETGNNRKIISVNANESVVLAADDLNPFSYPRCKQITGIKPLLRPLSDLYKEIDGEVGIVELAKIAGCNIDLNKLPINEIETVNIVKNYEVEFKYSSGYYRYFIFRNGSFYYKTGHERRYGQDYEPLPQSNQLDLFIYLFQHHYDVWNLIGQNLAIDKNTIE